MRRYWYRLDLCSSTFNAVAKLGLEITQSALFLEGSGEAILKDIFPRKVR